MITNSDDITAYTSEDRIYIPDGYKNANYSYRFNGDYIDIITNVNCIQQYNTTYCNCYRYNYKNNVISEAYSCSTNNNNPVINYNKITNDINYSGVIRERFIQDKGLIIGMFVLGLVLAIFLTKERKHL